VDERRIKDVPEVDAARDVFRHRQGRSEMFWRVRGWGAGVSLAHSRPAKGCSETDGECSCRAQQKRAPARLHGCVLKKVPHG
jgi:hypothetical protein